MPIDGASADCQVAIVGAGPYGLSVAAHLARANVDLAIFGEVMGFWEKCMPKGMKLRSPWGATHLSDPDNMLTLDGYGSCTRISRTQPLPVADFIAYGKWFQRQTATHVDPRRVTSISYLDPGFRLVLQDRAAVHARSVIIATGLANQEYKPNCFDQLPRSLVSHTSHHQSLDWFRGKSVAVVGRGQSACEFATLLKRADAEVEILCRGPIHWVATPDSKNPVRRLTSLLVAPSGVGPFPLNWIAEAPMITRRLPSSIRTAFTNRCVKPGAAGWLLPGFDGIRVDHGRRVLGAKVVADSIELRLDNRNPRYDHVLLATGYRTDIAKLGIFSPRTLERISRMDGSPRLSAQFESSLPGLYFVGSAAVGSFGPLVRFVAGAGFTARTVTRAIAATYPTRESAAKKRSSGKLTSKIRHESLIP